jgi:hypothetical protein
VPERVRIEVPDVRGAADLLLRLQSFDARLAPNGDGFEVSVESSLVRRDLNRLIDEVLDAVEGWLADNGVDTATVHVDGERYSMQRPLADGDGVDRTASAGPP